MQGMTDPAAARVARVAVDVPLPHLDRVFDYAITDDQADAARPGVRVRVRFAGQQRDGFILDVGDTTDVERLAPLEQHHELLEQAPDLLGLLALHCDLGAAHEDVGLGKRPFDQAEVLVPVPEQAGHEVVPGNADVDLGDTHAGACHLTRLGTRATLPDLLNEPVM